MRINLSDEVSGAVHFDKPIVALESAVIAHGLPRPRNLEAAGEIEDIIRQRGAVPATIAIFGGEAYVGLSSDQLESLATGENIGKASRRDLPIASARRLDCATTVATTAFLAHRAGIKVFSTGGIGGVHRGHEADISADLPELAQTPIIVVCSGPKVVLDLERTREWLETWGVTLLGWQCDEMPAFYARSSGSPVDERVEKSTEVARIADARNDLKLLSALLVGVPVPAEFEVAMPELERLLTESIRSASEHGIRGKDITPFLLAELASRSDGRTIEANIALLKNNARIAADIAIAL
jgi:pseudouridine-5'-phosphate glycosidase